MVLRDGFAEIPLTNHCLPRAAVFLYGGETVNYCFLYYSFYEMKVRNIHTDLRFTWCQGFS